MGEGSEQITEVKIYNRTYQVRSHGDPEYVRALAEYVHQKMSDVSEHTPTVDTLKVAILAALNIADECFSARRRAEELETQVCEKSKEMSALLDPFLGPASP